MYLMPTDFKADQVLMVARARGGSSAVEASKRWSALLSTSYASFVGKHGMSPMDERELLHDHDVAFDADVESFMRILDASFSPMDTEVLLQMIYIFFLQGSKLPESEDAKATLRKSIAEGIRAAEVDPQTQFNRKVSKMVKCNHPDTQVLFTNPF